MTNLRPFFCYFGGKWRAAPRYPAPVHDTVVEPFAGSAGYATRYADRKVLLVDLDEKIVGLWQYLIRVRESEVLALPDLEPDQTVDDLNLCQEAGWLIGFWLNKGAASPRRTPSKWMRAGLAPTAWWGSSIRERLAAQVSQIRHWKIQLGTYQTCPDLTGTWFIDPPYEQAGRHYRHSSLAIDFANLGGWCRCRKGQVIVCENEGATWLPFTPFLTIRGSEGAGRTGKSNEVIWHRVTPSGRGQGDLFAS